MFIYFYFLSVYKGRSGITQKSTANDLSLHQGFKVYTSRNIVYWQLLMLVYVITAFDAVISKLRLRMQRYGRRCGANLSYFFSNIYQVNDYNKVGRNQITFHVCIEKHSARLRILSDIKYNVIIYFARAVL